MSDNAGPRRGDHPATAPRHTVVYSTDATYWEHTYVSLYSLLVNNRDISLDVRVLAETPDDQFFERVSELRHVHDDFDVSWLPVDDQLFSEAPARDYFSKANYFRLMIGSLVPAHVERILYLDSDVIVRRSLRDLFALDIQDHVLAATPDYGLSSQGTHQSRLGLHARTPYFNSGVLLINLNLWRQLEIETRCMDYIRQNERNPVKLEFVDQDALNVVVGCRWRSVGPSFNFTEWTINSRRFRDFDTSAQLGGLITADGPAIVHYAGGGKPWRGRSRNPYEFDYWRYRQRTPYADRRLLLRSRLVWIMLKLPHGESALKSARTLFDQSILSDERAPS